jgi:hypothetical protein
MVTGVIEFSSPIDWAAYLAAGLAAVGQRQYPSPDIAQVHALRMACMNGMEGKQRHDGF